MWICWHSQHLNAMRMCSYFLLHLGLFVGKDHSEILPDKWLNGCLHYLGFCLVWPNSYLWNNKRKRMFWTGSWWLYCFDMWWNLMFPISTFNMFLKKTKTVDPIVISCHLTQWFNANWVLWSFLFDLIN